VRQRGAGGGGAGSSNTSSANGCQYRIAMYTFERTPRSPSTSPSSDAIASIVCVVFGDVCSIAARAAGARAFAIAHATGRLKAQIRAGGSVRISGSQKTLYRYSSTSSTVEGAPTESSSTPTVELLSEALGSSASTVTAGLSSAMRCAGAVRSPCSGRACRPAVASQHAAAANKVTAAAIPQCPWEAPWRFALEGVNLKNRRPETATPLGGMDHGTVNGTGARGVHTSR
jgi:hypothetical protein